MIGTRKKTNRKWERRPQLYKGRFFYVRKAAQIVLGIFAVIVVAAIWLYFKNSDAMLIRHVNVIDCPKRLQSSQIIALAALPMHAKLFDIDLETIEANLLRDPWVASASIHREFPDTLSLRVIDRQVVAILSTEESLYLIDNTARIFKRLEAGEPNDLPVISGFSKSELTEKPRLTKLRLNQSLALLNTLTASPFYQARPISEIRHTPGLGFSVFLRESGLEIFYGQKDLADKQAKLEKFRLSQTELEDRFIRLDLDRPDKVVARAYAPN
jgi:cell division septal protein FtsQ